jgi:hypothetical protein
VSSWSSDVRTHETACDGFLSVLVKYRNECLPHRLRQFDAGESARNWLQVQNPPSTRRPRPISYKRMILISSFFLISPTYACPCSMHVTHRDRNKFRRKFHAPADCWQVETSAQSESRQDEHSSGSRVCDGGSRRGPWDGVAHGRRLIGSRTNQREVGSCGRGP